MADRRSALLLDMIVGKWLSQAICVAAELGIGWKRMALSAQRGLSANVPDFGGLTRRVT
jgi:hypothetical protein